MGELLADVADEGGDMGREGRSGDPLPGEGLDLETAYLVLHEDLMGQGVSDRLTQG